ncbi:MAG: Pycsar system effector family protein [Hyphomicrobiales bacterium]
MEDDKKFLRSVHQDNLQRAIDFLKFAEAKNGAAVAYSSALVLTVLQMRPKVVELSSLETTGLLLCLLGGLIAVRSFVPQLDPRVFFRPDAKVDSNLLFFGDVAKLTANEYSEKFNERYCDMSNLLEDMSQQTSINSKIAMDKMNHFTLSLMFSVGGTVCLLVSLFTRLLG